ncbi:spore coat protein CotJB [Clostridia bacterium]|nr:spore coat protein CotJB [Clostridia bacterium]
MAENTIWEDETVIPVTDAEALRLRGMQYAFAMNDIVLFLDTHPNHQEALEYYHRYRDLLAAATYEYAERFGPVFVNDVTSYDEWTWVRDPFPWE